MSMDSDEIPSKKKKESHFSLIKCIICQTNAKKKVWHYFIVYNISYSQERIPTQVLSHVIHFTQHRYL